MTPARGPFVGRVDADAFVIDSPLIGATEALHRAASYWRPGARLLGIDDRWLLVLPSPVSVRAEQAPGLPVQVEGRRARMLHRGSEIDLDLQTLPAVDLSSLIELDSIQVRTLSAAPSLSPDVAAPSIDRPQVARTARTLRSKVGIGDPDARTARRRARLAKDTEQGQESRQRRGREGGGLSKILARTPAGSVLRRRHHRYIEDLTSQFERRDWDQALRSAIGLGGRGGGFTMSIPKPRSAVRGPGLAPGQASGSVPYGQSVHAHLRTLYLQAAQQLEQEGQVQLAAFVHADLLGDPVAAVELLERNRHFQQAAELADGWQLDPALVVRLWWRAGERDRAVAVARVRGAFADAIARLEKAGEQDTADELRRAWMLERRSAGDRLGAVAAVWPSTQLRDEVLPDIAAGITQGGALAGTLLAHLLEHTSQPRALESARNLLDEDPELATARKAFVTALTHHPARNPVQDRELATRAVRALVDGSAGAEGGPRDDLLSRLRKRADPLLVADLPRATLPRRSSKEPLELDATDAGQVSVLDAVCLGPNSILVALGELGVRLLTREGRTRAEWNIPTHRLILADHGARVLLLTARSNRFHLHRLDLPNGRPHPLPDLDVAPLDSYDGSRPVLVSDRGIEWVELIDGRWRVVWHELADHNQNVKQAVRGPGQMAAVFIDSGFQVWRWELPSITLRERGTFEPAQVTVVLAAGQLGRLHQESGVATLDWHSPFGHRLTTSTHYPDGELSLVVSGAAFALADTHGQTIVLSLHRGWDAPVAASVTLPVNSSPLFRAHAQWVTVGHSHGRILVLDTDGTELVADIRLSL